jgi:hypothetical protein
VTADEELAEAKRQVTELQDELADAYREQLDQAQRLAVACADELLACAITIAGLDETGRNELDIALDTVRRRAEDHGILRRRPPRAVPTVTASRSAENEPAIDL